MFKVEPGVRFTKSLIFNLLKRKLLRQILLALTLGFEEKHQIKDQNKENKQMESFMLEIWVQISAENIFLVLFASG
jgi:hypothetical protein